MSSIHINTTEPIARFAKNRVPCKQLILRGIALKVHTVDKRVKREAADDIDQ